MALHLTRLFVALTMTLALGACAAARPSPMSFSVRRVAATAPDVAFEKARSVLVDHGYRLEVIEPQAGRLITYPIDAPEVHGRRGAMRGRPSRQVVEIRVSKEDGETAVYCRVFQQSQTTEAHRLLSVEQGADDRPARTPIEREAATVQRQNVVWETVGRNKTLERAILSDILTGLGASTTS